MFFFITNISKIELNKLNEFFKDGKIIVMNMYRHLLCSDAFTFHIHLYGDKKLRNILQYRFASYP